MDANTPSPNPYEGIAVPVAAPPLAASANQPDHSSAYAGIAVPVAQATPTLDSETIRRNAIVDKLASLGFGDFAQNGAAYKAEPEPSAYQKPQPPTNSDSPRLPTPAPYSGLLNTLLANPSKDYARVDPAELQRDLGNISAQGLAGSTARAATLSKYDSRPGVPFDPTALIPSMALRARVSAEPDPNKQYDLLKNDPDVEQVRPAVNGRDVIVTMRNDAGKPQDYVLHPPGTVDIAGHATDIGKAALVGGTALATGGASLPVQAAALGTAGALTEAAPPLLSRFAAGQNLDAGSLVKPALVSGALNAAIPAGGALAQYGSKLMRGVPGALESRLGTAAAQTNFPLSTGLATGSPVLQRAENSLGAGGDAAFQNEQNALATLKARQTGFVPPPSQAALAARARPDLQAAAASAEKNAGNLAQSAQTALNPAPVTAATDSAVGKAAQDLVQQRHENVGTALQNSLQPVFSAADEAGANVGTANLEKLQDQLTNEHGENKEAISRIFGQIDNVVQGLKQPSKSTLAAAGGNVGEETSPALASSPDESSEGALSVPAGVTPARMQEISDRIRAIDHKLSVGSVYGKDKADLLNERLELGAEMGHGPSQNALIKAEEQGNNPDVNSVVREVVNRQGITNDPEHPMAGEIANLAENGLPQRLINANGNTPDGLGESIHEALVSKGLASEGARPNESEALEMVNQAYQNVPSKFPPKLDVPLLEPVGANVVAGKGRQSLLSPPPQAAELPPAPRTVEQAVNNKRLLGENVEWDSLGGQSDAIMKRVYGAANQDIRDALDALPQETKDAFAKQHGVSPLEHYDASNQQFSDSIQPFENAKIRAALRDPETGGQVTPSRVVPLIFNGKGNIDTLHAWRDALGGEAAPEYQALKARGVQSVIDSAKTDSPTGLVDAGAFLNRVNQLSPEIQQELYGNTLGAVKNNAVLMKAAQGAKIPEGDLTAALQAAPAQVASKVQGALDAAAATKARFGNAAFKALSGGELDANAIGSNPDNFVDTLLNDKRLSAADAGKVVNMLPPETREAIAQRTMQNIFNTHGVKSPAGQQLENLDYDKLNQTLNDPDARARLSAIVTPNGVRALDQLSTISEGLAKRDAAVADASGIGMPRKVLTRGAIGAGLGGLAGGQAGAKLGGTLGLALETVPAMARVTTGMAMNLPLGAGKVVRSFLQTGQFPTLTTGIKTALLAAPASLRAENKVLTIDQAPSRPLLAAPLKP